MHTQPRTRYYRDCHAAVVLYDITRADSFAAVPGWIAELRRSAGASAESLVIAIVGNKRDLESKRKVTAEQGAALAESLHTLSFETSALTVSLSICSCLCHGWVMVITHIDACTGGGLPCMMMPP